MSTFYTGNTTSVTDFQHTQWQSRPARQAHKLREELNSGGGVRTLPLPDVPAPLPEYDVFIAGSGPVGATYARLLLEKGFKVCMADVGEIDSPQRGSHKKNNIFFQKNIDQFVHVIQGALDPVSVPVNQSAVNNLNPSVWRANRPFVRNGANPEQDPFRNLGAQKVTRAVGGMATHWTCATPRFHRLERPLLDRNEQTSYDEWERLYERAEKLIGTRSDQFDESIRHNLVLRTLKNSGDGRTYVPIPLACTRKSDSFVNWHSANTVFNMENAPNSQNPGTFHLFPATLCERLISITEPNGQMKIVEAQVHNLQDHARYRVIAKMYILAAGAVNTPQILVNSGFASFGQNQRENSLIPNLGRFITEQTMTFCQVILHKQLVDDIRADVKTSGTPGQPDFNVWYDRDSPNNKNPNWWNDKVVGHMKAHPEDPLPIPFNDPEPQVTTLFNDKYHYHTQIHRDAFNYGAVAAAIDSRLVVDLRFFGRTEPKAENKLFYSEKLTDEYNMPQPTFYYDTPEGFTTTEAAGMMVDMVEVASKIGGYLPGSEPQYMEPGLALHLGGTHRSGLDEYDSVTDVNSKVHRFPNLFLGGVGNIPSGFGSNPTLTAMGYAIKSCEYIERNFVPSN